MDYGNPISYLVLNAGVDVISSDGERVGKLEHVLADTGSDVFDGLVIDIHVGPGGRRFADADQVDELYERAVVLGVPAAEIEKLPKPEPAPAVMESHGVEDSESPLQSKLHRAWDLISGKYWVLISGKAGMGEMRERMLRGELYIADDAENEAEFGRVQELLAEFNGSAPAAQHEREALLRRILRHVGEGVVVRAPFYCEYGAISIGDRTFVNVGAVMLDVAPITIGAACQIATRVQLLTATHPIDPEPRRLGWEYAEPITIADNVWLGGGVIVCPGVTIGEDTVVGAGAVVTRDLPAGVVAAGVPARVQREIGERDRVEVPPRST